MSSHASVDPEITVERDEFIVVLKCFWYEHILNLEWGLITLSVLVLSLCRGMCIPQSGSLTDGLLWNSHADTDVLLGVNCKLCRYLLHCAGYTKPLKLLRSVNVSVLF